MTAAELTERRRRIERGVVIEIRIGLILPAKLRERGWQVPAYTFPENRTDLAALRVVVRNGFGHEIATARIAVSTST